MAPRAKKRARKDGSTTTSSLSLPQQEELTPEEAESIRQAFALFDTNNSGTILGKEVKYAMRSIDLDLKKEEARAWLTSANAQQPQSLESVKVDLDTFTRMASSKLIQKRTFTKAFQLFDKDSKGFVSFEDMKRVVDELEEDLTDEDLMEMLEDADREENGVVNQDDFYRLMVKLKLV